MRSNCNLELRLVLPSISTFSGDNHRDHHHQQQQQQPIFHERMGLFDEVSEPEQKQELTIFHDGRVGVCDVTELQARAIILLASVEMEGKTEGPTTSLFLQSQQWCSLGGVSMKRSLQRFLQKRRHRIQATSPYYQRN